MRRVICVAYPGHSTLGKEMQGIMAYVTRDHMCLHLALQADYFAVGHRKHMSPVDWGCCGGLSALRRTSPQHHLASARHGRGRGRWPQYNGYLHLFEP